MQTQGQPRVINTEGVYSLYFNDFIERISRNSMLSESVVQHIISAYAYLYNDASAYSYSQYELAQAINSILDIKKTLIKVFFSFVIIKHFILNTILRFIMYKLIIYKRLHL